MEKENNGIALHCLEFANDSYYNINMAILLSNEVEAKKLKFRLLRKLNIVIDENLSPMDNYIKHLSELNNVAFTKPCQKDLANAIIEDWDSRRLLLLLA